MEKEITDVIYNLEDGQFYIREYDNNNKTFGKKIMVYDNKIIIDQKKKPIESKHSTIRKVLKTDTLDLGDTLYINNGEYICLYFDKSKTIICERYSDNKINNIHQIPTKDVYLKTGTASKEELKSIYQNFLMFQGLFKGICLDVIDGSMKRLLEE